MGCVSDGSTNDSEETKVEPRAPASEAPNTTIEIGQLVAGRYTVTDRIGQGSMGSVMRAHDARLRRDVALKLLRLDAVDIGSRERMVREAHAMAQLSHPNVVAIYDVEETRLGVLLVMELVEGGTLGEWVTPERAWTEVLGAYAAAARGLLAAHRVGIVHRDFKPNNVLVGRDDGQVKVADFGLAKRQGDDELHASARHPSLDGDSVGSGSGPLTEVGAVMGTPRYMAPEQHAGQSVSPAADQFSLCVALWEALHGRPPYANAKEKKQGPPAWERKDVPASVVRAVERGLAPAAEDRWPDLAALVSALQPSSQGSWKAGAAAMVGAGALIAVGAAAQPERTPVCTAAQETIDEAWNDADRDAVREAIVAAAPHFGERVVDRVQTELDGFASGWVEAHTDACEATHVRNEQSAEVLDLRMACLRRAKGDLSALAGVFAEADEATVTKAHVLLGRLPSLDRCADTKALKAEVPPPETEDAAREVEAALELISRANALQLAGKLDEATATLESLPTEASEIEYGPLRAHVLSSRGHILEGQSKAEAAFEMQREALGHALEFAQWTAAMRIALRLSIVTGKHLSNPKQSAAYYDLALGMARRPDTPRDVLPWIYNGHAGVLDRLGDTEGSRREHEKALAIRLELYGPDHWRTALSYNGLATVHYRKRELEKARQRFAQGLKIQEAQLGRDHPLTTTTRSNLASVLLVSGNAAEAEPVCLEMYEQSRRVYGDSEGRTYQAANTLAAAYSVQGKYDKAYAFLTEILQHAKDNDLYDFKHVLYARDNYAIVLSEIGQHDEAIAQARSLLDFRLEHQGEEHADTSRCQYLLGDLLRKAGKLDEALPHLERSLAIDVALHGPEHPDRASALVALGKTHGALGQTGQGIELLREAWSVIDEHELSLDVRGECAYALAQLLVHDPTTRAEALAFGEKARDAIAEDVGPETPRHAEISKWLAAQKTG